MPRRRLKHKDVVETLKQQDTQVAKEMIVSFWTDYIRPYEGWVLSAILAVVVVVGGGITWRNYQESRVADANLVLSQARTDFESGDVDGAKSELTKVRQGGEYALPGLSVAADMVYANIAFASGEYETAITILTRLIPDAPEIIQTDLRYQLAAAQESNGDFEAALKTLEAIEPSLGDQPDNADTDRQGSVWDRYYFQKGRILLAMGKSDEGTKLLSQVARRSAWNEVATREILWNKAKPSEAIATSWTAAPQS